MVAINDILLPECTGEECGGDNEVCTDSRVHRGGAENRAPVTRNYRSAPIPGLCEPLSPLRLNRFLSLSLRLAAIHCGGHRPIKSTGQHLLHSLLSIFPALPTTAERRAVGVRAHWWYVDG